MKVRIITAVVLLISVAALAQLDFASLQRIVVAQDLTESSQPRESTSPGWTFRNWAGGVQSVVTVIAIVAGGILAWRNLHIFRAREPHVTISHQISHRLIGTEYVHISVTATLHNSSRVQVEFRDGSFTLQQVSPVLDEEVERLYVQVFVDEEQSYLQWRTLYDFRRAWGEDELVVEPGESEHQTYEFIVGRAVESVVITTYFFNARVFGKIPDDMEPEEAPRKQKQGILWRRKVRGPMGWGRSTIYDIISTESRSDSLAVEGQAADAAEEETTNNS